MRARIKATIKHLKSQAKRQTIGRRRLKSQIKDRDAKIARLTAELDRLRKITEPEKVFNHSTRAHRFLPKGMTLDPALAPGQGTGRHRFGHPQEGRTERAQLPALEGKRGPVLEQSKSGYRASQGVHRQNRCLLHRACRTV